MVHLSSNKYVRELNTKGGAGEMIQLLRAVVAHAEELGWMPAAHGSSQLSISQLQRI